jgi:hypothetical protein
MRNLLSGAAVSVQAFNGTANNGTVTGAGVDMSGYSNVVFLGIVQSGKAGTVTMKAQQDTDAAYGSAADLLGTSVSTIAGTAATAYGTAMIEISNPRERYVRPLMVVPDMGTAAVTMVAIRFGADYLPVTNTGAEVHLSPAEGTA